MRTPFTIASGIAFLRASPPLFDFWEKGNDAPPLGRRACNDQLRRLLCVEELSPPLGEIVVLIHQRIPNCNFGITVPVGAARSKVALFHDDGTKRILQLL